MASKVAPVAEEEGAKVEGAKKEGGAAEEVGAFVSVHGHFGRSWASLRRAIPALMARKMVK